MSVGGFGRSICYGRCRKTKLISFLYTDYGVPSALTIIDDGLNPETLQSAIGKQHYHSLMVHPSPSLLATASAPAINQSRHISRTTISTYQPTNRACRESSRNRTTTLRRSTTTSTHSERTCGSRREASSSRRGHSSDDGKSMVILA